MDVIKMVVVVVGPDCNCYFCMGVYDEGWLPCFTEVYTNSYERHHDKQWKCRRNWLMLPSITFWRMSAPFLGNLQHYRLVAGVNTIFLQRYPCIVLSLTALQTVI